MVNNTSEQYQDALVNQERYSHGYDSKYVEYLAGRTSSREAAFLTPYLQPGMSLLDCGCGPGTITIGLAKLVAPGQVVGIDIAENQIALAREVAYAQGVSNVKFEVGNINELPFPDRSFDSVFAHTVLQHLANPVRALKEIHRILKASGLDRRGNRGDDGRRLEGVGRASRCFSGCCLV